jgi:hypothetical protein
LLIEIYEVDILDAKLSGLSATQIPDCLRDAAGDEPTVRQANLLKSFKDLREPPILPESDFQIVQRFGSHRRPGYLDSRRTSKLEVLFRTG